MDLLEDFIGYDTPYRHFWTHPVTGEPFIHPESKEKAFVDVYSPKSVKAEEYEKAKFQEMVRDAKKNNKKPPAFSEVKARTAGFYAEMTASFYFFSLKSGTETRDPGVEELTEIYANPHAKWMIAQLDEVMGDDGNFLPQKTSGKA